MNQRMLLKIILIVLLCASGWFLVSQNSELHTGKGSEHKGVVDVNSDNPSEDFFQFRWLADGSCVFHALTGQISKPFVSVDDPTAAGGKAIEIPSKSGKNLSGRVSLDFELPAKGCYTLWARTFWGIDGQRGCSNSIAVQIDESTPVVIQDATYEFWHWVQYRQRGGIEIPAGKHTINLINREDGIRIDQVFLTPWYEDEFDRRVPQGVE
ncbi:MAG: hypothetical protein JXA52_08265 [Planctomycetes bacterium]|nr:hypothetical protein [Planctomycetota bacterium]